jgi:hypothetical protein
MEIQVNTDKNIASSDKLAGHVQTEIEHALSQYADRITRVEVHLRDESAGRSTAGDKRCMLEARPSGGQPVAVTDYADTLEDALHGALAKLVRLLESKFARRNDPKGGDTIRTVDPTS